MLILQTSTVWWPALCGNDHQEGHEFWSLNTSQNSSLPDISRCFQNSVLVWLPCSIVCVSSLIWMLYLHHRPSYRIRRSIFNISKLVVAFVLFAVYLSNLVRSSVGHHLSTSTSDVVAKYALQSFTAAVLMMLMSYEYKKMIISSGVVSVSWLLFVLFYLVEFRSRVISAGDDVFQTVTFFVSYSLIFVQFVFCFIVDRSLIRQIKSPQSDCLLDQLQKKNQQFPEERCCFFSRLTFSWITRLMISGYRRVLVFDDLWELREMDRSEAIVPEFRRLWEKEVARSSARSNNRGSCNDVNMNKNFNKKAEAMKINASDVRSPSSPAKQADDRVSLWRVILQMCGTRYIAGGLMRFIYDVVGFVQPVLLNFLITFIKEPLYPLWLGLLLVAALFAVSLFRTIVLQQYWHKCYVVGQHLRTALVGIVYRKSLKLSNSARQGTTIGEIVNLMAVDAQRFNDAPSFAHMLWSTPLTVAICVYMLWQVLGPSVLAGLLCIIVMVPINAVVFTKSKRLQVDQMKYKDIRTKMITEVLNGIKVLKLYSWEEYFKRNVLEIRDKEINVLRWSQYLSAVTAVSWFMTPYLVALSTFAVYVLSSSENVLDANKAFVSLTLFNMLNYPLSILPMVINVLIQCAVSVKRLKRFLLESELQKHVAIEDDNMGDVAVKIQDGNFAWERSGEFILRNMNLTVPRGKLVAIVGQVGSGKSSLISGICGEMDVSTGKVHMKGSVAYVPQLAWIQNATIRDNILFSKTYSVNKYRNIVEACSLAPDYHVLPAGDQTEVGEKGINLSGGQKQRLSLARALYQDADIYLLDDPLSAVDSHVGKHIFDRVIGRNGLLKNKTRIFVTNQATYLPQMDLIVVLKNGTISEIGTYQDLMNRQGSFAEFIQTYLQDDEHKAEDDGSTELRRFSRMSDEATSPLKRRRPSHQFSMTSIRSNGSKDVDRAKLVEEEKIMTGNVKMSVFLMYMKSCGIYSCLSLLVFYTFFVATQIYTNIWLGLWSNDPPSNATSTRNVRLGVYGGLGIGQAIGVVGMSMSIAVSCTHSSSKLHSSLLHSILRAPMSFFDTTPLGRIINRFSGDIDTLDVTIPISFRIWLFTMTMFISTIFVISYATPIFVVALIPLAVLYYFIQRFYISTSRQLRRIDSNCKSPIYVHFGETVAGCSSIRAYGQQARFCTTADQLINRSMMTNYSIIISNRWLGIWLEILGSLIVLLSGVFVVLQKGNIDAGLAGLSLSYSLQITATLNLFVRMTSELETNIVSVERIEEYTRCPQEAPSHTLVKLSSTWPDKGSIQFINYSARYRDNLDLALKDFSCTFNPEEKIGIAGRTGAGKSSLALALFRIIEAASGAISIDDVTISTLGLHDLRSRLTIIPQDPVLFSGTLKMNLDPSGEKSDEEIWTALGHAHLRKFIYNLPDKLMTVCSEGGENLSVGQRQLVCLARALLRKTNILVLDEATAAVDLESDDLIQKTIRVEFEKCTVVTIAHRLNTIIDYNRILVLDRGRMMEFDSPQNLLSDPSSNFYKMAKSANLVH